MPISGGEEEADGEIGAEAIRNEAIARYLAQMTRQLESMARASKLELLTYLLAMARAEAENLRGGKWGGS
jgi:hypothetical protein